jgi:hypothetical protein
MARWSVVGLMGGLAAGTALALPRGGEELVTPLLLPAVCAAGGVLLGAAVGLATAGRGSRRPPRERLGRARRAERRHSAVVEPEPAAPPPPPDLSGLPAPPSLDGAVPEGWYTDPLDDSEQRWWDGGAWTSHVWRRRART